MDYKKMSEMTDEDIKNLPHFRFEARRTAIKNKAGYTSGYRQSLKITINGFLTFSEQLKEVDYSLLLRANGELVMKSFVSGEAAVRITKGQKDNSTFYYADMIYGKLGDHKLVAHHMLSNSEVLLIEDLNKDPRVKTIEIIDRGNDLEDVEDSKNEDEAE